MGRIKSAAVAVACIVLGAGLLRVELLTHHPAPAPPPARTGGGGRGGYDVLALAVVGLVVIVAIALYWRHRERELRAEVADLDGFHRRRSWQLRELWECPVCGALLRLDGVAVHQNPDYSLCAFFSEWLNENEGTPIREFIRAFRPEWPGVPAGGDVNATVSMSATMAPDHSVTGGGYDSLNPGRGTEIEE